VLASIPFQVYEFATSPVPNAVMLGGDGIPGNLPDAVRGIPVNQKASTLYFLHTARIDRRRNENEVREGKVFELAQYIIRYADGEVVKIPVRSELDIDDYRQRQPSALPGAFLAWTKPAGDTNLTPIAMQWTNPRPGVVIASIDLEYGKDRVGVPTLLAVSAVK
jgi:beta-galactosidase